MKKLRDWFIGHYLASTDNVFVRSRIELLFNFTVFYLLNVILFWSNCIANGFHYHAAILGFSILFLVFILFHLRQKRNIRESAILLLLNQTIVGIVSYLIQESTMDFVGEFFIVVNVLIAFFMLGKEAGFIVAGLWLLQLLHCLANDATHGKFILIHIPKNEILPPAPFFVLVPFGLCVYIIYQFVKTRSIAESDIQEQKRLIEDKNKEITDSIRYASRIQRSILPNEKVMEKNMEKLKKA